MNPANGGEFQLYKLCYLLPPNMESATAPTLTPQHLHLITQHAQFLISTHSTDVSQTPAVMLSKILILLASLTLVASSAVIRAEDEPQIRRCGNPDPSPEYMKNVSELLAAQETHVFATSNTTITPITITADLYFHVLSATNELSEGWATVSSKTTLLSLTFDLGWH
jgi:hypothetical protein